MSELVFSAPFHSTVGDGTLSVYGPDGARAALGLAGPLSGDLAAPLTAPRWGTLSEKFGGGLALAMELAAEVVEPPGHAGVLDDLRTLYPDERDVWVRYEGPNGRGQTVAVDATVTGVTVGRSLSPVVAPDAPAALESRCGLAKLGEADGPATAGRPVLGVVSDALNAVGGPGRAPVAVAVALAHRPTQPAPDEPAAAAARGLRFAGKLAGSDTIGDNGTAEGALLALCQAFTLSVFLPATAPATGLGAGALAAGERRFYAVPRTRAGAALGVATHDGADDAEGAIPADVVTVAPADWIGSGTWGRLAPLGRIEFEPTPDVEEARAAATNGLGVEMGDGETAENAAFSLVPDPTLQLRLTASGRVVYDVSSAPAAAPGRVRVVLRDRDGAVHYGTAAGWQSALAEHDLAVDGTLDLVVPLTLPAPGTVSVVLVGETETYSPDGSAQVDVDAVFNSATLAIEYEDGDAPVSNVHVTVGEARFGARTATAALLPRAEVLSGAAWSDVEAWGSDVASGAGGGPGGPYALLPEATAAERLAQEGARLRFVRAFLPGRFYGPETRLVFAGRDTDPDSPFPTAVPAVAVGLAWDHGTDPERGAGTDGLWVEAREGAAPTKA